MGHLLSSRQIPAGCSVGAVSVCAEWGSGVQAGPGWGSCCRCALPASQVWPSAAPLVLREDLGSERGAGSGNQPLSCASCTMGMKLLPEEQNLGQKGLEQCLSLPIQGTGSQFHSLLACPIHGSSSGVPAVMSAVHG